MKKEESQNPLRTYSISELAQLYSITVKCMNRWLAPHATAIGKREGRYYNIKQVAIIFNALGVPGDRFEEG
jgi:hypothetical protein